MAEIYYDEAADSGVLAERKVAILGYGSQGHAHALNLRDSGVDVRVGLRESSSSWQRAEEDGLAVMTPAQACEEADLIMVLTPDPGQAALYKKDIEPYLTGGKALAFAHGFSIRFAQIVPAPNVDVFLIAPKGPGHLVRRQYSAGQGVPVLIAVHQDATGKAWDVALSYAKGIGGTRAGALKTTFAEETETDLFGEQVVLCGGLSQLITSGFNTLVEAGYQPEVAYFECLHEVKLIVDLLYEGGLSKMRWSISETAEYGDYTRGPRVVTDQTRQEMRRILGEIRDGSFAREWVDEYNSGLPRYNEFVRQGRNQPVEQVGRQLRSMMSWLPSQDQQEGPAAQPDQQVGAEVHQEVGQ